MWWTGFVFLTTLPPAWLSTRTQYREQCRRSHSLTEVGRLLCLPQTYWRAACNKVHIYLDWIYTKWPKWPNPKFLPLQWAPTITCKQEKKCMNLDTVDQNQASFICVNKSDASQISANVFVIRADKLDTPWHSESYVTESAAWALIRPRLCLLRLNMQIVSFCSTLLKPKRRYDAHT